MYIRSARKKMERDGEEQMKSIVGLTEQEAIAQAELGNVNVLPDRSGKSVKSIITENVFTYFNAIFVLIAVFLIIAGSYNSLRFFR